MNNQIQLRGNICTCSGVWFCYDIPESDPSRCPYCNREIDDGELYDGEDVAEGSLGDTIENIENVIDKASGETPVTLVAKVCDFCTNELFFDEEDAPNATNCPYCEGSLVPTETLDPGIGNGIQIDDSNTIDGVDINELIDCKVAIKYKSTNPFNKTWSYVFKGVDSTTQMVKLQTEDSQVFWEHLTAIQSIFKA